MLRYGTNTTIGLALAVKAAPIGGVVELTFPPNLPPESWRSFGVEDEVWKWGTGGMRNHIFHYGKKYGFDAYLKDYDDTPTDLTDAVVTLRFRAMTEGGTSFTVDSDAGTWVEIKDALNGVITVRIPETPSPVPATGGLYRVGATVKIDTEEREGFGDAIYDFIVPPEGSY